MDKIELIDRVELVDTLRFCKNVKHMQTYAWIIEEVIAVINDFPTIDAAPVRRSEWVTDDDDNDDWAEPYCEKCGCFIPRGPAHFCPNCGADMRKVSE